MKVNSSKYLFILGSLVLGLVLLVLVLVSFFELWKPITKKTPDADNSLTTHVDPSFTSFEKGQNLQRLNQKTEQHLHNYGILPGEKDFVHIPIKKAIEHLLKQEGRK